MAKSKAQQALDFVRKVAKTAPSGTDLHNAFFGNYGEFGKLFPTREEREAFSRTPQYAEIVRIREELDKRPKKTSSRR
jgi:hypothetical protein